MGGLLAIIALLLLVFHSPMRVLRIIAPLAAAVVTVTAGLALFGQQLIILHLVGLLLVVAVGSNYALFFDRTDHTDGTTHQSAGHISPRTLASMLFANLTAVAGFGLLAFSERIHLAGDRRHGGAGCHPCADLFCDFRQAFP